MSRNEHAFGVSLLCAFLAFGCQEKSVRPVRPPPSPTESAKDSDPERQGGDPEMRIPVGERVSFDEELVAVSKLRGLVPQRAITGLRVSREELLAHVEGAVRLERPEVSLEGTEAMLVGLGLVEVDFDFEATMLNLLSSSLAGLYEPRLQMMLLRKELPPAEARVTLLHELVHALQDQYFELQEIVDFHEDDTDVSSALSSLAEGDATSAMLDGVLPEGQTALDIPEDTIRRQFFSATPTGDAPPVILRSLFAPYLDGFSFVNALRRRGGWEAVNVAWRYCPKSTEQILHLDKYDAREEPLRVDVPAPPSDEWEVVFHDIWGEQTLRIVLEEWVPDGRAAAAAAGWGGDRIAVFRKDEQQVVAWTIVMDSVAEAKELEGAMLEGLVSDSKSTLHSKQEKQAEPTVYCGAPKDRSVRVAFVRTAAELRVRTAPYARSDNRSADCSLVQQWLETRSAP